MLNSFLWAYFSLLGGIIVSMFLAYFFIIAKHKK